MKKIYFIVDPLGPIYYMNKDDDWDEDRLDIGYNDHYEMRSVRIAKWQFSENFNDIKKIAEYNKKKLMETKYKELLNLMKEKFEEEDATFHDGFEAP